VVKGGDKCTKFFHSIANSNRKHNAIDTLMIGETILLLTKQRSMSTLSSSIQSFFFFFFFSLSNAGGGRRWMVYPSTPFRRLRHVGWRETLNRKRLGK
jgi:hypothetical protein